MRIIIFITSVLILINSYSCINTENLKGSNLVYQELEEQYHPMFFGDGKTLIVEIENVGGLNIRYLSKMVYQKELYLGGIRVSSGPKYKKRFYVDISQFNLKDDWENHVYWWDDQYNNTPESYNGKSIPDKVRTKITIKPISAQY